MVIEMRYRRYMRYGRLHRMKRCVCRNSGVVENSPFANIIYIERVECKLITILLHSLQRSNNEERRAIIISNILSIVAKILERLL